MSLSFLLPLTATALLLLPSSTLAAGTAPCCGSAAAPHETQASAEFLARVDRYVDLHRALEAPLGPEQICGDPEQLQRSSSGLAAAIRQARAGARPGDVFSPEIAAFFRATVASVVRGRYDVPALLDEMDEEGLPQVVELEVNGAFPWLAGNLMPPGLLRALPPLPEELEYRLVGPDLVLLDVRANLVVDWVEDALTAARSEDPAVEAHEPCDVHPELPGCWM